MKISQLILQLQEMQLKYGDVEVFKQVWQSGHSEDDSGGYENLEIDSVRKDDLGIGPVVID